MSRFEGIEVSEIYFQPTRIKTKTNRDVCASILQFVFFLMFARVTLSSNLIGQTRRFRLLCSFREITLNEDFENLSSTVCLSLACVRRVIDARRRLLSTCSSAKQLLKCTRNSTKAR